MTKRFTLKCATHGVLRRLDGQVLLLRRFQTGWRDGQYSLPAGHLDGEETLLEGTIREVAEEAGVTVQPADLTMAHVMHRAEEDERLDFFFIIDRWEGEPKIAEPDKADDLLWVFPQKLPENTVGYIQYFFEQLKAGNTYSEFGW